MPEIGSTIVCDLMRVCFIDGVKSGSGVVDLTSRSSTCRIERAEFKRIESVGNLEPPGTLYTWPAFSWLA